jgi:NAD(P)-dependent dehydrogenase (short-subunit alcohol dehydrogenase family)
MKIDSSCVALVTGGNRGIGLALVRALQASGVARVYVAARRLENAERLAREAAGVAVPLELDVRRPEDVAWAAAAATDVNLLVNNGGVNHQAGLIASADLTAAREEMETNYFGALAMCRAFAPILARNGGGAIVNMLSILGRVSLPAMGSLAASKAAALSMTHGVRAELRAQGTLVVAVMPAAVDTRMAEGYPGVKAPPSVVAEAVLQTVREGREELYADATASALASQLDAEWLAVVRQMGASAPAPTRSAA